MMKKKILAIDNDKVILEFISDLFSGEKYQVLTANDGLSALDIVTSLTPDIIFLDMIMPLIDGYKLCKVFRSMERLNDTPIIVLSATLAETEKGINAVGADAYIAKGPFKDMSQNILAVVNKFGSASSQEMPKEVIGIGKLYKRRITEELLSVKRHFETILEKMHEAVLEVSSGGRILYANPALTSLTDIPEEQLIGMHFAELFPRSEHESHLNLLKERGHEADPGVAESPVKLGDRDVMLRIIPVVEKEQSTAVIMLDDVTESMRAKMALQGSEARLRRLVETTADPMIIISRDGILLFANQAAKAQFGRMGQDSVGSPFGFSIAGVERTELDILGPDGEIWVGDMGVTELEWEGEPAYLAAFRDVSERKRVEEELKGNVEELTRAKEKLTEMSITDELTGLYNRRYFIEAMEKEISRASRYGTALSLGMVDLDHLKLINDNYGHLAGDEVISGTGKKLKDGIRESDIAFRCGGEEFAALLPNTHIEEALITCERVRQMIAEERFEFEGKKIKVTISAGVVEYDPSSNMSFNDLMKEVDHALYKAKREGRNRVCT